MKNITQLVFKPKKRAIAKGVARPGTAWFDNDDPDEIDALATLAIKAAGFRRSDFFKPVRVDHLVVDDMPAEGVFDTAFCDRYKLAEDGKSWLLPAAQPNSTDSSGTDINNQEQGNEDTTSITDSGDTTSAASSDAGTTTTAADSDSAADADGSADATADTSTEGVGTETVTDEAPAYELNVNGEPMAEVEKEMLQPVVRMDDRHRILSQFILEDEFSHRITPEQLAEVSRLELDQDNRYIQHMLLACHNAPGIQKLDTPNLWKFTDAYKRIFLCDGKDQPLCRKINFAQAYADAHPIDRGLLVKEWIEGNYISRVEKTGATSTSAATEPQQASVTKTGAAVSGKPAAKTTYKAIDTRIGCALTKGEITYPITARDVEQGKAIVEADGEEFKRWSATYRITENIQFYDEKTHIEMIRQAPREVVIRHDLRLVELTSQVYTIAPGELPGYLFGGLASDDAYGAVRSLTFRFNALVDGDESDAALLAHDLAEFLCDEVEHLNRTLRDESASELLGVLYSMAAGVTEHFKADPPEWSRFTGKKLTPEQLKIAISRMISVRFWSRHFRTFTRRWREHLYIAVGAPGNSAPAR